MGDYIVHQEGRAVTIMKHDGSLKMDHYYKSQVIAIRAACVLLKGAEIGRTYEEAVKYLENTISYL